MLSREETRTKAAARKRFSTIGPILKQEVERQTGCPPADIYNHLLEENLCMEFVKPGAKSP